jgi:hypothetical protein
MRRLERWRLVAFGDAFGVEGAFGVDAVDAVLFSRSTTDGHHDVTLPRNRLCRRGFGQFTGRQTQGGKE